MNFKKGDKVILSEKGHRDFFYPSVTEAALLCNALGKKMNWTCGNPNMQAFLIPECSIILCGSASKKSVVWFRKY
tara:strand:- start:314 stop:538 length:225 start_codon:yes stop_codon:yes gene_type:complete